MKLDLIKIGLIIACIALIVSSVCDVTLLIKHGIEKNALIAYIHFEEKNIETEREHLLNRIKTAIDFKSESQREYYKQFSKLESKGTSQLEELVLTLFPGHQTLDSVDYLYEEEITMIRNPMLSSDYNQIKAFYNNLLSIPMLETLAHQVDHDSGDALARAELVRSIESDSVYVAVLGGVSHLIKYAYRINGQYFEENWGANYEVSKSDTLHIEIFEIIRERTSIDTISVEKNLVYVDGAWHPESR